jgi:hypothetical protein
MSEIERKRNHNDMENPPASLISHKIFEHSTSRGDGQDYTQ